MHDHATDIHSSKVVTPTSDWPQWVLDVHKQISDFLESPEFAPWIDIEPRGENRRMLDYACGSGLVSKALKPLFSSVVGVDVSSSMLDKYRATASALGLEPDEMIGVRGDLLSPEPQPTDPPLPEEDLRHFDLAAISLALHHMEDPVDAAKKLAARLKPGGKLLVIDWTPIDGSTAVQRDYQEQMRKNGDEERLDKALRSHAASHTVSKPNGFTKQDMTELFEQGGCKDIKWKLAEELSSVPIIENAKGQFYWASATKI